MTAVRLLRRAGMATLVAGFLIASPSRRLAAQEPAPRPELIDRIVAVVGDQAILLSEVNERIQQSRNSGLQIPDDSVQFLALQRQVLGAIIDDELLYQRARRDTSITVTDAEVQTAVEQQYRSVRGQFRSDAEFLTAIQAAGWGSIEEYRRYLSEQSRRSAFAERFVDKQRRDGKLRSGTVSEAEMRDLFAQAQRAGQLDSLPPTITFRQIVVAPKPSDAARAAAARLADSVHTALERGADFTEAARRFSDDPGSKDSGGALGFFRRGTMVRPFEEVAFSLRPGVISPVVRTEYGYHIIIVDRVQPGEIKARHILFAPVITAVEQAAARRIADSAATLLRAGANSDSLARVFGDSAEPHSIGPTDRTHLPQGYAAALAEVEPGQLVGPVALSPEAPERTRWLVAQVAEVRPKRVPTFEDVREQVRARLVDQKGYRNLIEDLKRQMYVDVRL
jgi:peptidyl-prolyl cis-trans isomerase SurA